MMLSVENLTIRYGKTEVVHNISFYVEKGEIVTILGANGAGKSTILNSISGVHHEKQGTINFCGKNIINSRADQLVKSGIRIVPEGRQIFPEHTVLENLLLGAYTVKNNQLIQERIEQLFLQFPRLKERKNQLGGTLSGGEQQMLAIARALITNPTLLLLDEPSLGLAPLVIEEVFQSLKRISSEGVTVLLVEQRAQNALNISDRAYVLETGNIVIEGTAEEIKNDAEVVKAYLGQS